MNATLHVIIISLLREQFGPCIQHGKPVPFEFKFEQLTVKEQTILRNQENLDALYTFMVGEEGSFHG
jgi:hypothetical protein